jgi:hypothetical protein
MFQKRSTLNNLGLAGLLTVAGDPGASTTSASIKITGAGSGKNAILLPDSARVRGGANNWFEFNGTSLDVAQNGGASGTWYANQGFTTAAGSGTNGLTFTTDGARLKLGSGVADYLYSDGTLRSGGVFWSGSDLISSGFVKSSSGFLSLGAIVTRVLSSVANGASAVAIELGSVNNLTTTGAKLVSITNNNGASEKAYFDKDGGLTVSGVASGADAITIPTGSRLRIGGGVGQWFADDTAGGIIASVKLQTSTAFAISGSWQISDVGATISYNSFKGDSGTAVAHKFSTNSAYTTAGAKLASWFNSTTEKAFIDKDGGLTISGSVGKITVPGTDSSGTPGAATINKMAGQVSVANGASSVVVTNSLVSSTSVVLAVLQDNTDAIQVRSVVPGSGTFTINLTGVTTAARKVGFVVMAYS